MTYASSSRDDNLDDNLGRIEKTAINRRDVRNTIVYIMSVLLIASALTGGIYASAQTDDDDDSDDDDDDNGRTGTTSPPPATTSQNNSAAATIPEVDSANRTFYVFTDEVEDDFDDQDSAVLQAYGFPDDDDLDIYSLQTIVVNRGDLVTIHFFNLDDDDPERHSFTMGAPYAVDEDLAGEDSASITIQADTEGVFQYYSKHDLPQMKGQFVVLPSIGEGQQSTNTATNSSGLATQ